MNEIEIAHRKIGDAHPPVVIAEIGINHEGSIDAASALADCAIDSGAEIVKHQTHIVEDEMSMEAKLVIPTHDTKSIYEIIERCALSESDEFKLMRFFTSFGMTGKLNEARKATFSTAAFFLIELLCRANGSEDQV